VNTTNLIYPATTISNNRRTGVVKTPKFNDQYNVAL